MKSQFKFGELRKSEVVNLELEVLKMKIIIIFIDLLMATVLFFVGRFFIKSRNTERSVLFLSGDYTGLNTEKICRVTGKRIKTYLWVDCAKKDVASVEQSLNDLLSDTSHIKLNTYHAELQTAEYASRMMKLGCYLFMAIVGLIGFMNLANTMIINITTKKQEYGVLQAVGMTNKQLNLSLQIQGLIFTVGTICVALAAGLPLGYALFSYAKHNGIFGMNVYHVPLIPILVMILLVGILQIVLSCVLSSNLKKETLVERIRYQG